MKKYVCEECGKEATVYWKENINGNVKEAHLCADCAQKKEWGKFFSEPVFEPAFFEDFFPSFPLFSHSSAMKSLAAEDVCPTCGETVTDIRENGRFGCPDCYRTFRDRLDLRPFIGRGYRGKRLTGRTPEAKEAKKEEDPKARVASLRKQLKKAVAEENYEEAARLRDTIRGLEA